MLRLLRHAGSTALAAALLVCDAIDAIFRPAFQPIVAWLASLSLFRSIGDAIARLPAYAVLALLAVPFAIVEPFKFVGLFWLAQGRIVAGLATIVAAYIVSLFVCERIFRAGRARLMTIGWFARAFLYLTALRERAIAWVRASEAWRAGAAIVASTRGWIRRRISARTRRAR